MNSTISSLLMLPSPDTSILLKMISQFSALMKTVVCVCECVCVGGEVEDEDKFLFLM